MKVIPAMIKDLDEDKVNAYYPDGSKKDLTEKQQETVKYLENVHIRDQKIVMVVVDEVDWENYIIITEYELNVKSPDYMMLADKIDYDDGPAYNFWAKTFGWKEDYGSIGLRATEDSKGVERAW